MTSVQTTKNRLRIFASAVSIAMLSACGGGSSGEQTRNNVPPPNEAADQGIVYNGPSATNEDVKKYQENVWQKLASPERCGQCHVQGDTEPMFVRTDDINLARAAVSDYVNLESPAQSKLVSVVAEGHNNCWRPEASICAEEITNFIEAWATETGVEAKKIVLEIPVEKEVGSSKSFPVDSAGFANTIHPLLKQYCGDCHKEDSATQQQPYFSSNDVDVAYQAAKSKINLDVTEKSRLVIRLRSEFHNCWDVGCAASASMMEAQIVAFSEGIPITAVDPDLLASRSLGIPDGTVASSGGRFESNAIALFEFKNGRGATAFDTSGTSPAMDLNMTGDVEWVGSWGIRVNDGKAQAATSSSKKLHDLIKLTGEYSIEAWLVPDNVTQDGPARIITYSGSAEARNFTLGQTLYDYNFLSRSSESDENGMPMISTPSADEILQATLQHVVVNFDPIDGRSVYVNGELENRNPDQPGNLNEWDDTFAFAVGSEVDSDHLWKGTVRLIAVHNRVLTEEQIVKNFDAGVGEKFFLPFGVSHLVDIPNAYIVFQVQQFDNYAYLFDRPFFTVLGDNPQAPDSLVIEGMRVGVNGQEAQVGQSFANINVQITAEAYNTAEENRVVLSSLGSLVPLEKGADNDQFFLTFDRIGTTTYARPAEIVPPKPKPEPNGEQSDIGVRTFGEVNATLATITGVPITQSLVAETYQTVQQQMPTVEDIQGFLASHQSGVMQLSVAYCTALVNDTTRRSAFFPGVDFSAPLTAPDKAKVIQPLLKGLLAHTFSVEGAPTSLSSQPVPSDIEAELDGLLDNMSTSNTATAVIATCASALGSAVMLVQ